MGNYAEEQVKEYIYNALDVWITRLREEIYTERECRIRSLIDNLKESSEFDKGYEAGCIDTLEYIIFEIRNRWKHYEAVLIESD